MNDFMIEVPAGEDLGDWTVADTEPSPDTPPEYPTESVDSSSAHDPSAQAPPQSTPPQSMVDPRVFHELAQERQARQVAEDRIGRMLEYLEQGEAAAQALAQEATAPSRDEDPIAYIDQRNAARFDAVEQNLAEVREFLGQRAEAEERRAQEVMVAHQLKSSADVFKAQTPDFGTTVQAWSDRRARELAAANPGVHPAEIYQHIDGEIAQLTANALGMGGNPAEWIYNVAVQSLGGPMQPTADPQPEPMPSVQPTAGDPYARQRRHAAAAPPVLDGVGPQTGQRVDITRMTDEEYDAWERSVLSRAKNNPREASVLVSALRN